MENILESIERFKRGELTERAEIYKVISEIKGYRCGECEIASWNGKPLTFQVDYINGLENDNSPENLRLICSNCQSQKV